MSEKLRVSEARLNDMCYMVLKHAFFTHVGSTPRQCDIRVCMDMAAPERITSVMNAILLPNETAGTSHTTFYEVDPGHVFDVCITYLEEHWVKAALWTAKVRRQCRKNWLTDIIPELMKLPEEECAAEWDGKEESNG